MLNRIQQCIILKLQTYSTSYFWACRYFVNISKVRFCSFYVIYYVLYCAFFIFRHLLVSHHHLVVQQHLRVLIVHLHLIAQVGTMNSTFYSNNYFLDGNTLYPVKPKKGFWLWKSSFRILVHSLRDIFSISIPSHVFSIYLGH